MFLTVTKNENRFSRHELILLNVERPVLLEDMIQLQQQTDRRFVILQFYNKCQMSQSNHFNLCQVIDYLII